MNFREIIIKTSSYLKEKDLKKLERAYELAEKLYDGYKTPWGIPYIVNYPRSLSYLLELKPDVETLCACLLQRAPFLHKDAIKIIRAQFGDTIARLVENLHQVIELSERNDTVRGMLSRPADEAARIDALRKMFLAISNDIRVILVRLAEKINRLENLHLLETAVQKPYAREALDIFVPIADRLGIFHFKRRLEDLCFMRLEEKNYQFVKEQFQKSGKNHATTLTQMKDEISKYLKSHGIKARVEDRIKGYFSVWSKMKQKNFHSIDQVQDLYAVRVILKSKDDCYRVLGLIHNRWHPIPERFKDYIAAPKINGYRSLHTTILGIAREHNKRPVEIQIRTEEMHREAQFGIAAHWWYKEEDTDSRTFAENARSSREMISSQNSSRVEWVKNLMDLEENLASGSGGSKDFRLDLFNDRIFVLTPSGEVRDLPKGATVLDFAYEIHSDVGNHCVRARVNGENVSLDYELNSGDTVDILTDPKKNPNRYWLSIVKTAKAKEKIRSWIKSLRRKDSIKEGKDILNKHLRILGMPVLDPENLLLKNYGRNRLNLKQREELLEDIAKGKISPSYVVKQLFPDHAFFRKKPESLGISTTTKGESAKILVTGEEGFEVKEAKCCQPKPGDSIVGYTTRGGVVSAHKLNCRVLRSLSKSRRIELSWKGMRQRGIAVSLKIALHNTEQNIAYQVTRLIEQVGGLMINMNTSTNTYMLCRIEMPEYDKLDSLINRIEYMDGVKSVEVLGDPVLA